MVKIMKDIDLVVPWFGMNPHPSQQMKRREFYVCPLLIEFANRAKFSSPGIVAGKFRIEYVVEITIDARQPGVVR
jgi:hypothetical protein